MAVEPRFRRNVRTLYAWLGSLLVLIVGPLVASRLIDGGSFGGRAAGVVVGVISVLPWMWVVVRVIRAGDEFTRRMHLVAASIAFGGTLCLLSAMDWLSRAYFIEPPDLILISFVSIVIWFIALVGVKRYFARVP